MSKELKEDEIVHPLLNDGKKLKLPSYTFGTHKAVMRELAELEIDDKELKEIKYQNLVILYSLEKAGISITEKDLDDFHPTDRIMLFNKCYLSGRKGFKGDNDPFLSSSPKTKKKGRNSKK